MKLDKVVKSSSIYGGGGFVYDTSLDGADSIQITESLTGSMFKPMVVTTALSRCSGLQQHRLWRSRNRSDLSVRCYRDPLPTRGLLVTALPTSWFLNGSTVILNSTILGGDISGTLAGNDSLSIAATTLQTSTVYGGAGADTILIGSTTQVVDVDINAFAGADSLSVLAPSSVQLLMLVLVRHSLHQHLHFWNDCFYRHFLLRRRHGADLISATNAPTSLFTLTPVLLIQLVELTPSLLVL